MCTGCRALDTFTPVNVRKTTDSVDSCVVINDDKHHGWGTIWLFSVRGTHTCADAVSKKLRGHFPEVHVCVCVQLRVCVCVCTRARVHASARRCACTGTNTGIRTHTRAHAPTGTQTRTHLHTHRHVHTHTHTHTCTLVK